MPTSPPGTLLGVELKPIPPDEFRKTHTTHYRGGLAVVAVRPDSPAAAQGILPGDVLVGMHIGKRSRWTTWPTSSSGRTSPTLGPVKFFILRGDETLYGYLPAAAAKTRSDSWPRDGADILVCRFGQIPRRARKPPLLTDGMSPHRAALYAAAASLVSLPAWNAN